MQNKCCQRVTFLAFEVELRVVSVFDKQTNQKTRSRYATTFNEFSSIFQPQSLLSFFISSGNADLFSILPSPNSLRQASTCLSCHITQTNQRSLFKEFSGPQCWLNSFSPQYWLLRKRTSQRVNIGYQFQLQIALYICFFLL